MTRISISPQSRIYCTRVGAMLSRTEDMVRKRSERDPDADRMSVRAGLLAGLAVLLGFSVTPWAFLLVLFAFVVYAPVATVWICRQDRAPRRCRGQIGASEAEL